MKVLIDSDVCIDVLCAREPYVKMSLQVFMGMVNNRFTGCISADSYTNIFYLLRKNLGNEEAVKKLIALRKVSQVGSILPATIDHALGMRWSDFEDALQHQIALENDCDYIITRNISDFQNSKIPVLTPSEFVEKLMNV